MSNINFYIVRHGETLLNSLHRAQGWVDSPLTQKGIETAKQLGKQFNDVPFVAAFSSDTIRAYTTAQIILEASNQSNIKIHTDNRLREWCLGRWEAENNDKFIADIANYFSGKYDFVAMNTHLQEIAEMIFREDLTGMAEPFDLITQRLLGFLTETGNNVNGNENRNILLVTHAFSMKTLLNQLAPDVLKSMGKISNGEYIKIIWDGLTLTIRQ